jgi:hypothetical protein
MRYPTFAKGWHILRPPGVSPEAELDSYFPLGAMRFSSLDRQSLARWDERFHHPEAQLIYGSLRNKANLRHFAEQVFYRFAPDLLSTSQYPPDLPVVYNRHKLYRALAGSPVD